jgi:hypothetical protein
MAVSGELLDGGVQGVHAEALKRMIFLKQRPLALKTRKPWRPLAYNVNRCGFWNDCHLLNEGYEVDHRAVRLLPSRTSTRQPTLLAGSLIGLVDSRSQ